MPIQNQIILDVLSGKKVARTPMWIMRQAGRYLPEYQEVRKQAGSFINLCKSPELASEVTIQPLRRFALDAAIIFSDILTIPDAMGMDLKFEDNKGPYFEEALSSQKDLKRLNQKNAGEKLEYVYDAIKQTKIKLDNKVPLIGFAGSPWTLCVYMVEGKATKEFRKVRSLVYEDSAFIEELNESLCSTITSYLVNQVKAGANVVMLFDSWGGLLNKNNYEKFSLEPMKQIIKEFKKESDVPVILFTRGGGNWLPIIIESGCDCIGLDWTVDINHAKSLVGNNIALQGNLDPCALHGDERSLRLAAKKVLEGYGEGHRHIFNLGHGIDQFVNPDNVNLLVEILKEESPAFHQN